MSRSLIVMPDDSARPILDAIAAAKQLAPRQDVPVLRPGAARRGDRRAEARRQGAGDAQPRAPRRRAGERGDPQEARKGGGRGDRQQSRRSRSRTRSRWWWTTRSAFVKSLNWETKNLTETRDYAITTAHRHEVDEVIEGFEADWHRKQFDPGPDAQLIWCTLERARPHRRVHRRGEAFALRAERALPGPGHHRAPGARRAPGA